MKKLVLLLMVLITITLVACTGPEYVVEPSLTNTISALPTVSLTPAPSPEPDDTQYGFYEEGAYVFRLDNIQNLSLCTVCRLLTMHWMDGVRSLKDAMRKDSRVGGNPLLNLCYILASDKSAVSNQKNIIDSSALYCFDEFDTLYAIKVKLICDNEISAYNISTRAHHFLYCPSYTAGAVVYFSITDLHIPKSEIMPTLLEAEMSNTKNESGFDDKIQIPVSTEPYYSMEGFNLYVKNVVLYPNEKLQIDFKIVTTFEDYAYRNYVYCIFKNWVMNGWSVDNYCTTMDANYTDILNEMFQEDSTSREKEFSYMIDLSTEAARKMDLSELRDLSFTLVLSGSIEQEIFILPQDMGVRTEQTIASGSCLFEDDQIRVALLDFQGSPSRAWVCISNKNENYFQEVYVQVSLDGICTYASVVKNFLYSQAYGENIYLPPNCSFILPVSISTECAAAGVPEASAVTLSVKTQPYLSVKTPPRNIRIENPFTSEPPSSQTQIEGEVIFKSASLSVRYLGAKSYLDPDNPYTVLLFDINNDDEFPIYINAFDWDMKYTLDGAKLKKNEDIALWMMPPYMQYVIAPHSTGHIWVELKYFMDVEIWEGYKILDGQTAFRADIVGGLKIECWSARNKRISVPAFSIPLNNSLTEPTANPISGSTESSINDGLYTIRSYNGRYIASDNRELVLTKDAQEWLFVALGHEDFFIIEPNTYGFGSFGLGMPQAFSALNEPVVLERCLERTQLWRFVEQETGKYLIVFSEKPGWCLKYSDDGLVLDLTTSADQGCIWEIKLKEEKTDAVHDEENLLSEGWYTISTLNNQYLEVDQTERVPNGGFPLSLNTQFCFWEFVEFGKGLYYISKDDMYLGIYQGLLDLGSFVLLEDGSTSVSQLWRIKRAGDHWMIIPAQSDAYDANLCLSFYSGQLRLSEQLKNDDSVLWKIEKQGAK